MSDRIAVMSKGQIVQEGTPRDIYAAAANRFVADFIGSANLVRGTVREGKDPNELTVETPFGIVHAPITQPGLSGAVMVAIRPEDIAVHRGDKHDEGWPHGANVFPGEIQIGLFGGTSVDYHVQLGETLLHARAASRSRLERGDRVNVELPPDAVRVFALPRSDTPVVAAAPS